MYRVHTYGYSIGYPELCMDEEGAQIRQELIDGASDEINESYDQMLNLLYRE